MDLSQIIVVMTIIVTNMGAVLYLHFRSDDKIAAAMREGKEDMKEMKQETNNLLKGIQSDVKAMHEEMKDFHGRLCKIEERNRK